MHKTMLGDDLLSNNHRDNKLITDITPLFRVRGSDRPGQSSHVSKDMMARLLHVSVPSLIPRQKEAVVCFKF